MVGSQLPALCTTNLALGFTFILSKVTVDLGSGVFINVFLFSSLINDFFWLGVGF